MKRIEIINYCFSASTIISLVFSILLWFFVEKEPGIFVAIWVPTILGFWIFTRFTTISKIPLKLYLMWIIPTFSSLIFSILLWFFVDELSGIFVGVWVSSIILFGSITISGKSKKQ
tara:strand:- start:4544 stop:4891 length:348 start_codon:yes stop_codon:yes gene_type:complete